MKISELFSIWVLEGTSKTTHDTWNKWISALRADFDGVWLDGDSRSNPPVQAMLGQKPYAKGKTIVVGEWDGTKGAIYTGAKELAKKFSHVKGEKKEYSSKPDANGVIENPDPKSPLGVAKKMLGAPKIKRRNELPNTDLDNAKRVGFQKVDSAAGPWYVQLFTYLKNSFVQVQSPTKDVFYVQPVHEAISENLFEGVKYKPLRTPVDGEPSSYQVTGWHATSIDNWPSIRKIGLKPGKAEASGQTWDSKWKGKAIYYHLAFPEHEIDNCSYQGELHSVVIEANLHGFSGYFVPDEDVSDDVGYTPTAIKNKEAIAYGYIVPRSDIVAVHLPDIEEAHEWADKNCKGFTVRFHQVS